MSRNHDLLVEDLRRCASQAIVNRPPDAALRKKSGDELCRFFWLRAQRDIQEARCVIRSPSERDGRVARNQLEVIFHAQDCRARMRFRISFECGARTHNGESEFRRIMPVLHAGTGRSFGRSAREFNSRHHTTKLFERDGALAQDSRHLAAEVNNRAFHAVHARSAIDNW